MFWDFFQKTASEFTPEEIPGENFRKIFVRCFCRLKDFLGNPRINFLISLGKVTESKYAEFWMTPLVENLIQTFTNRYFKNIPEHFSNFKSIFSTSFSFKFQNLKKSHSSFYKLFLRNLSIHLPAIYHKFFKKFVKHYQSNSIVIGNRNFPQMNFIMYSNN